mmetsp:Transcript_18125/g.36550  ORF Transcript_18125/g.36550 Transcript_18125/m.36550 type:complete len:214 (+) Transcript_18125:209-850(+)
MLAKAQRLLAMLCDSNDSIVSIAACCIARSRGDPKAILSLAAPQSTLVMWLGFIVYPAGLARPSLTPAPALGDEDDEEEEDEEEVGTKRWLSVEWRRSRSRGGTEDRRPKAHITAPMLHVGSASTRSPSLSRTRSHVCRCVEFRERGDADDDDDDDDDDGDDDEYLWRRRSMRCEATAAGGLILSVARAQSMLEACRGSIRVNPCMRDNTAPR